MAGWPEPRGSMAISYFWASDALFPPQGETPDGSTEARGVGTVTDSCMGPRGTLAGADTCSLRSIPGRDAPGARAGGAAAGSGHPAALAGIAVMAGRCGSA